MAKETQTAFSSDGWIEQTNRARCDVSGILKRLSPRLNLPQIQISEVSVGHINLATNLKHSRLLLTHHLQGKVANGTNIVGNIISNLAAATC